ncbi:MAG: universal stress protein [Saprospiraceae bacterium]|nr:universal stress protein [Saprospiraceae bacterium]
MFKILCPSDLSVNAGFAIEYATNLCKIIPAELHIVSSYKVPASIGYLKSMDDKIKDAVREDLENFSIRYTTMLPEGIKPFISVVQGNTSISVLDYATDHQIDMIVMGTRGSTDISKLVLGSITKKLFSISNIPILAIPQWESVIWDLKKLVLCLDGHGISNEHSINLLRVFKSIPGLKMDVFHVTTEDEKISLAENTKLLGGMIDQIIDVEGIDPVYEIKKYTENNDISVLAMVRRKHNVLERLFIESNTTAELFATNKPILMLPE